MEQKSSCLYPCLLSVPYPVEVGQPRSPVRPVSHAHDVGELVHRADEPRQPLHFLVSRLAYRLQELAQRHCSAVIGPAD